MIFLFIFSEILSDIIIFVFIITMIRIKSSDIIKISSDIIKILSDIIKILSDILIYHHNDKD